jgi:nicotinamide mononucleotide adenylyltransferase
MLDISIQNITKALVTPQKRKEFLSGESFVTEKADGTKLTLVRNGEAFDKKDFFKNFVLAYKGTVIYEEDCAGVLSKNVKRHSIGNAQYSLVVEHFKRVHHGLESLPLNTEFFIEFLMVKPTLTRDYLQPHKMILIGYSSTRHSEVGGMLYTEPSEMATANVSQYAKLMKIDSPRVILKGKLFPFEKLLQSSVDEDFSEILRACKKKFEVTEDENYIEALSNAFLSLPSKYGGEMEGVVIEQPRSIFKILQPDQHDKEKRKAKKERYQMEPEREAEYFTRTKLLARKWLDDSYETEKKNLRKGTISAPLSFKERLKKLSIAAYQTPTLVDKLPYHDKKNVLRKQEDFHYMLKYLLIRDLPVNNNALFIGRLQPPSKMHVEIIEHALQKYNSVVVAIVRGKKSEVAANPFSFETQKEILEEIFGDRISIVQVSTGNLFTAIEKSNRVITAISCGADRASGYENQLRHNPEIKIDVFDRKSTGVSGTKIRESLLNNDKKEFNKNVHPLTKKHWEKLRQEILSHE